MQSIRPRGEQPTRPPALPSAPLSPGRRSVLLLLPVAVLSAATASIGDALTGRVAAASRRAFDVAGSLARSAVPAPSARVDTSGRAALSKAVLGAMGGRSRVIGVSVLDRRTGAWWHYRGDAPVRTGSVAKVLVVAAALRRARAAGQRLSAARQEQARLAITRSDNAAADALYAWVGGHSALAKLAGELGMATTAAADPADHWGLTLTTPNDLVRLMQALHGGNPITHPDDDATVLDLMSRVVDGQRWGVGTVRTSSVKVHVKNGWMLVDDPWVINSVGDVRGGGRDYAMALMQRAQPDQDSGIIRASRIGRAVFAALEAPLR
ncbi:class A beta-lactamase-related serine hydrolase [Intrasporangium calvum]|uniref:Class A beta-lactamase-related serine hydrolase n=1 Tax=Intrasporangium calvum TaxID=53358 RepID=A0ABT5GKW2_9MICO|nr:serine hydrolase [Intrasporangium calvum]MDC5698864.1 class A beta-lactamase-related serine hydrolase [Intrasporangium calvum]